MDRQQLIELGLITPLEEPLENPGPEWPRVHNHLYGGRHWWQQCGRKRAYRSLRSAMARVDRLYAKGYRHKDKKLSIYICPWCDWMHVGNRKWHCRPMPWVNNEFLTSLDHIQMSVALQLGSQGYSKEQIRRVLKDMRARNAGTFTSYGHP